MFKLPTYLLTILTIFPLFACQKSRKVAIEFENKSYINNFELIQENSNKNTSIRITSPKAIIDQTNNDIEILDSSIEILKSNGQDIKIKSGKSSLNNYKNLISVYDKVNIYILSTKNSFIETNSFDWDLNKSNINFNSPLYINFDNTIIISSYGFYDLDSAQLKIYNNVFNRNIFNTKGEKIYQIRIISDMAKWLKENNSLEFTSNDKQVETTINFLSIK